MNPIAIDADGIAPELIAREKDIAIDQIKAEGKPAEMAEKIAAGKINKFIKESALLGQAFVKDGNKSVADYLKSVHADLKITEFKRVALG
jgi:elongation factor Ts